MEVQTTGTVIAIEITTENAATGLLVAIVYVLEQTTQLQESFILWLTAVGQFESPPLWVVRGLNVSLLREALVSQQTVSIWHDSASSFVDMVEFGSHS
jgi:hypothetical protein